MDRPARRPRLAHVGLAIVAVLVFAACAGPGPNAHGAGAPLAVTDGGPAPGVLVYVGEPAGSQRRSPPTGQPGIWVQSVETGENALHNCPPGTRRRSGPAPRSRADYACSG
ncbi:MAG: hypothetical protein QOF59_2811 [Actinomycetota bacterium]|nr:hypothetical protein [Actinomycetota bacterium]